MTELQWKPRYELGIPLIDEQHKRIFFLLNQLHQTVVERKPREDAEVVFQGLMRQTAEHFHTEETLMSQMRFPGLESHRGQHAKLMDGLHGLEVRFREGDASMAMLVTTFLGSWLRHHIHEGDRAYADFLAKRDNQDS
jgi:hemerythrin-like metal-binding protein